jgi:hypothetical protein
MQKDEVDGPCSTHGQTRNVYKMLTGNPGGGRPLMECGYWPEVKGKIDFK